MILDVDFLIDFFKKHTKEDSKEEMGEQDVAAPAASSPAPSTGGGGGSVPKWADTYNLTRGKANKLGLAGEKWETGLTRGAANQIW
jgi:hypothetical protein